MSLNWQLTDIPNWKEVCYDEDDVLKPVTTALIWSTISVGIREITSDTAAEFYSRRKFVEAIDGGTEVSKDDLLKHIGLRTNASQLTRLQFLKQFMDLLDKNVRRFEIEVKS